MKAATLLLLGREAAYVAAGLLGFEGYRSVKFLLNSDLEYKAWRIFIMWMELMQPHRLQKANQIKIIIVWLE